MNYYGASTFWAGRRKFKKNPNHDRRYSHNQWIGYDPYKKCYYHRHHDTVTVEIYPDKYKLFTGGWDTITTWQKMHEIAPFRGPWKHKNRNVVNGPFLWDGDVAYEWEEGIEVDDCGRVLNAKPATLRVRRVKPGAGKDFTKLRKAVMAQLEATGVAVRLALGEFEGAPTTAATGEDLLACMEAIAEGDVRSAGFLFLQRERMVFGRRSYYGSHVTRTARQCLTSSFAAARAAFHEQNGSYYIAKVEQGERK